VESDTDDRMVPRCAVFPHRGETVQIIDDRQSSMVRTWPRSSQGQSLLSTVTKCFLKTNRSCRRNWPPLLLRWSSIDC